MALQHTLARLSALELSPDERLAVDSFLERYKPTTKDLYACDLIIFITWCQSSGLSFLDIKRVHLEQFSRFLMGEKANSARSTQRRLQTLRSFYHLAVADEFVVKDPTVMLQMPKYHNDPSSIAWLDRFDMSALFKVAHETSVHHETLVALMGMMGLRVSEACNVKIEDYAEDALGYHMLSLTGKGDKPATMPVPVPALRIMERCRGDRTEGFLILKKNGKPQDRHGAYSWVKLLAEKAGLPKNLHPHSLRHAAVTAIIDSGADIRVASEFARHSDLRTTEHYYRRKGNPDMHGAHIAARVFAGMMK